MQEMHIKTTLEKRDPNDLKLLEINARFMRAEQYNTLLENIKRDGGLTSVPLVWQNPENGEETVLSGNHRTMAARDAGLTEIDVMLIKQPLTEQQRIAIQLSHNAIAGEDDPSTLRILYDALDDVESRLYSGLDDKTLELLENASVAPMSEANLDYQTVMLVFLPHEIEAATQALREAKDQRPNALNLLAGLEQYEKTLDALETAHSAANIVNVAGALGVILQVFEENLEDLQEYWLDEDGNPRPSTKGTEIPMETALGTRLVQPQTAANIVNAVKQAKKNGDLPEDATPWDFLSALADEYVASNT